MNKFSKNFKNNIVYSTNKDFVSQEIEDEGVDKVPASGQMLKVWLEKNSRGGKTVCVIKGFRGPEEELEKLGKVLKSKCGVGGSVKDGEIIIQGDHRDKIIKILSEVGYAAKKAGG